MSCLFRLFIAAFFALAVGLVPSPATAGLITYNFNGTITSTDSALSSAIHVGDTLTGSFTFESSTAPNAGSIPMIAFYNALTNLQFNAGTYNASSTSSQQLSVANNFGDGNADWLELESKASNGLTGANIGSKSLFAFTLHLEDNSHNAFSTALVLPTDIGLGSFNFKTFKLQFTGPDGTSMARGQVTSFARVTEPASLLLMVIGFVAFALWRWRTGSNKRAARDRADRSK